MQAADSRSKCVAICFDSGPLYEQKVAKLILDLTAEDGYTMMVSTRWKRKNFMSAFQIIFIRRKIAILLI
jgi:hypothetical protein